MRILRAVLIAVLATSMLLPTMAAATGTPPCMQASEQSAEIVVSLDSEDKQCKSCCDDCDDCSTCDAPCAVGGIALFNPSGSSNPPFGGSASIAAATVSLLPSHTPRLLRPPIRT